MAQVICANAKVSMVRYTPDRRTQNQPYSSAPRSRRQRANSRGRFHGQLQAPARPAQRQLAPAKVGRMAKRVHAAGAEDEVQAGCKQRGDQHVGASSTVA